MKRTIGRFEVRRELGRGAQSVVHLAWDPRLEREVALKALHLGRGHDGASLLAEARAVSSLRHAGIVPVFEAGEDGGEPYLVYEYVPGESLAAVMRRGALPAPAAADLMLGILAALAEAHAQDIVHRDLKPSNVLIDPAGRTRVMDFGIARRIADTGAHEALSGTPGYMAPEYVERREIGPRNDVYAAGVLLLELLAGRPLHHDGDVGRILERTCTTAVSLPADCGPVDAALAAIALRAAALDPRARFADAAEFRTALEAWRWPADDEGGVDGEARPGAVEFLLRRIRHRGDFPALSASVVAINRIAASESESVGALSALILRDFSLTNKLLRVVNAAHFRPAGGGRISTISRAVLVLGFDAVRNIAITVLLFEHLQGKSGAGRLKEEFLHACLAGLIARGLAARMRLRDTEQSYICALFHNLGRLLCEFYFPEESEDIRRIAQQQGCSEDSAAQRVLGVSHAELGIALAHNWGFPEVIQNSMRRLPEGPVRMPADAGERQRALAACANAYCDAVSRLAPAERERTLDSIARLFGDAVPVSMREARDLMRSAIKEISEFARVAEMGLAHTRFGRQLRHFLDGTAPAAGAPQAVADMPPSALLEQSTQVEGGAAGSKAADPQAVLSAGIQDISNTLVEEFRLNDVLRIILETMYRAMGFRRVLLCVRDARSDSMCGRFGFGPEVGELTKQLRFSLAAQPDNVFNVATARGVDVLISDVDDPGIAARIPAWYRKSVSARTFVLFPLMIKGRAVAMIYADKDRPGELRIAEQELAMLRTLRNQAVLAIKQAG